LLKFGATAEYGDHTGGNRSIYRTGEAIAGHRRGQQELPTGNGSGLAVWNRIIVSSGKCFWRWRLSIDEVKNGPASSLGKLSRRSFLTHVGAAGVATAASAVAPLASPVSRAETCEAPAATVQAIPGTMPVTLRVNGQTYAAQIDPRATLLDTLRETLHLTGTKKGCDHGQCGACTVHVNGRRVNSCLAFAAMQQNADITTIEGLGGPNHLHPMQAAFNEHDGYQCGYCTSGQIMSAVAMIKEPWGNMDADVKEAMSGNICRCGAYPNIVAAVQAARRVG
jgi:xanthine dehydrogenase YagT iron-sulfur-binding subunit